MRQLHVDQIVTVSLDEEPETIPCRVLDVQGPVSRLAYRGEIPPRTVGRLVTGAVGYLLFNEFRAAVGLRVAVRASPPYLDVALIDGITVSERRGGDRVRLVTRVRIIRPDAGAIERPAAWTNTINLSERGALLRAHPQLDSDQRFGLELMFGDDPRPVTAQAQVVRRVQDGAGVAFESIPADDATRLHEYLTGLRHQRSATEAAPAAQIS